MCYLKSFTLIPTAKKYSYVSLYDIDQLSCTLANVWYFISIMFKHYSIQKIANIEN